MIAVDCKIKQPSKPENGERLCWNVDCRRPLPKGKHKWCERCNYGADYYSHHHIGTARNIVIAAACEEDHHNIRKQWMTASEDPRYICFYACKPSCSICGEKTDSPEVDHIVPMNGDDRTKKDCRHHPSNLRVLCRDCHLKVSAVQAKARAAIRKGIAQMRLDDLR